jgi:hypothetical protein
MTILKNIWLSTTVKGGHELRIDWVNERHEAIALKALDPDSVKQCLLDAVRSIGAEQHNGHL